MTDLRQLERRRENLNQQVCVPLCVFGGSAQLAACIPSVLQLCDCDLCMLTCRLHSLSWLSRVEEDTKAMVMQLPLTLMCPGSLQPACHQPLMALGVSILATA